MTKINTQVVNHTELSAQNITGVASCPEEVPNNGFIKISSQSDLDSLNQVLQTGESVADNVVVEGNATFSKARFAPGVLCGNLTIAGMDDGVTVADGTQQSTLVVKGRLVHHVTAHHSVNVTEPEGPSGSNFPRDLMSVENFMVIAEDAQLVPIDTDKATWKGQEGKIDLIVASYPHVKEWVRNDTSDRVNSILAEQDTASSPVAAKTQRQVKAALKKEEPAGFDGYYTDDQIRAAIDEVLSKEVK